MRFSVLSASWTRALDMSLGSDPPTGYREITFTLQPDHIGGPLYLRTGGTLLGYGKKKWHVGLTVSETSKDAPWKGLATVYPPDESEEERFLFFSLKLTREEMDDCWNALVRGVRPATVTLDLHEKEPAILRSKEHKYDMEWNDKDHAHVELRGASFRYVDGSSQNTASQQHVVDALKEIRIPKLGPIIVGLLAAILMVLIFKR
jgi:hypothetical protein